MKRLVFLVQLVLSMCFWACNIQNENTEEIMPLDPHSYAAPEDAMVTHLSWKADVDFSQKKITAVATLKFKKSNNSKHLILDTKDLEIKAVYLDNAVTPCDFTLQPKDEILGSALIIPIKENTGSVSIEYATTDHAEALQWLEPAQTAGGEHPFLFTQSQAILARSWIPLQDSPGIRFTYDAEVTVPGNLLAVMSASNPQVKNDSGVYHFEMKQPIPAYLMALAVGDIAFKSVGPRTGVYSEPSILESAAYEFAEMEEMLTTTEAIYGPYQWERYDLIVLPPSFPFGGMENPRLTFATPTVIAGDRSLTSLVAHELAHSWSGNLVTNATWNDFWLNEGFTVYIENRIMEALNGKSYSDMLAGLALQDLQDEVESKIREGSQADTRLFLQLEGRNPDEGVSSIAYDKGFFFLKFLELKIGRERFDAFLKQYFADYQFQSMTTEKFVKYVQQNFKDNIKNTEIDQWIYGEGIPETLPAPESERFEAVDNVLKAWEGGSPITSLISPEDLIAKTWSTHEWLHFIRNLPDEMNQETMRNLDEYLDFTYSGNSEILAAWFMHVIRNEYNPGYENLENFLVNVGRRKFLAPLYAELIKTENGMEMASRIYSEARLNYHYVTTNTLDKMLNWDESSM